jgi:hypothetical protein
MATPDVTRPLPDAVKIGAGLSPRFSPNQMRALRAETGRTMEELLGEGAEPEDRLQAVVWLALRRDGYVASWEDAGDVGVEIQDDEPDPTNGGPSTSWPPSVGSGG